MTDHPLTDTAAAVLWDNHRGPDVVPFHGQGHDYVRDQTAMLRAAFDAGREHEREHADPHHDPRPWQDCTRKDIREGDLVEAQVSDLLRGGVAHHQDADGDWWTEGGYRLTGGARRPLRRVPAPTPPAEEVELPGVPCVLTDVQLREALAAGVALWTGLEVVVAGFNGLAAVHPVSDLTAFTLPDGTRARRDGEHADGTPRFVKVEADQ